MFNQDSSPMQDGGASAAVNPKKLFIGNLPFRTTEEELQELFGQYGELVEVKLISDRMTGRSRGIAFVQYATDEQAAAAVEALNGYEIDGRAMIVNVARPQAPRENRPYSPRPRTGGSGFGGGGYGRRDDRGGSRGGYGRRDDRGGSHGGYND